MELLNNTLFQFMENSLFYTKLTKTPKPNDIIAHPKAPGITLHQPVC
jgi:hypothetical protein